MAQFGGSLGPSTGTVSDSGVEYLSLSYTWPTGTDARTDITYTPERATSIAPANWSANGVVPFNVSPGRGNLETVTVRSTTPVAQNGMEFLRLTVTETP